MIKVILSSSPNSGAPVARRAAKQTPYPDRKLKETHELIFSWLSWLAVLLVGAYARRRRQRRRRWSRARWRPCWQGHEALVYRTYVRTTTTTTATTTVESRKMAARLTGTWTLGLPCTSLTLDIHVMINWHLSKQGIYLPVSRDHIAGSILPLIEVMCFFEGDRWPVLVFRLDRGLMSG